MYVKHDVKAILMRKMQADSQLFAMAGAAQPDAGPATAGRGTVLAVINTSARRESLLGERESKKGKMEKSIAYPSPKEDWGRRKEASLTPARVP